MRPFELIRPDSVAGAIAALARIPGAKVIAGGTNLLDLMKCDVERPEALIDVNGLGLTDVTALDDGGMRLGALVSNADVAYDPRIEERYPLLATALLAGASGQLRNMATVGGNLLQRTRCTYFYDVATPCNKREPGSGCGAIRGRNRGHAILGYSDACIATHPSDMCVALAALDAVVNVEGPRGRRAIPIGELHRLPGASPEHDTTLAADELILSVDLPPAGFAHHASYLKVRDRQSYAFALVSVAVAIELDGVRIVDARLALGGVAPKPWRRRAAEDLLIGTDATVADGPLAAATDELLAGAKGFRDNAFKIELARRAIRRAWRDALQRGRQHELDDRRELGAEESGRRPREGDGAGEVRR
jgi:xanthine dehydrogenase YagS FAD-binding subunit